MRKKHGKTSVRVATLFRVASAVEKQYLLTPWSRVLL